MPTPTRKSRAKGRSSCTDPHTRTTHSTYSTYTQSSVYTDIAVVHTRMATSVAHKKGENLKRVLLPRRRLFYTAVHRNTAVEKSAFHVIMPSIQGLPQRKELRVQPDRRRQAGWAVPGARSTARQSAVWVVPEAYSR